jgi:hypothetical protein
MSSLSIGIVGPATWEALTPAMAEARKTQRPTPAATRDNVFVVIVGTSRNGVKPFG